MYNGMIIVLGPGSSHSDKEAETPEKAPPAHTSKTVPVEKEGRKRKRKVDDGSGSGGSGSGSGLSSSGPQGSAKNSKKIVDYFNPKISGGSPGRGSKSPSHQSLKNVS